MKGKNIGAKRFALGLRRPKNTLNMNAARFGSFRASVAGSLLKYVAQNTKKIWQKNKSSLLLLKSFEKKTSNLPQITLSDNACLSISR